jgi:DNA polymerase-1
MEHICLIDGSNMIHRSWAMAKKRQRTSDGMEIGATWLFSQMVAKLFRRMEGGRYPPSHAAIFFDPSREATWRREIFPAYKAHRPEPDPEFKAQLPLMIDMCKAVGLACATEVSQEADDLIAAYTEDGVKIGARVTIVSGDKDLMQLVRPRVMQYSPVQDKWFNEAGVEEKFGISVAQVGDFLAMAGDKSDGIPGAAGIGPKSAVALLKEFGTLGAIMNQYEQIERKGWRKIIGESKQELRMSKMLVQLDASGCPRPLIVSDMSVPSGNITGRAAHWCEENLVI